MMSTLLENISKNNALHVKDQIVMLYQLVKCFLGTEGQNDVPLMLYSVINPSVS